MSATLAHIAEAAGTSISTVSRVLTAAPAASRISLKTRNRVIETAQQLGYRPNLLARSLRTRKTHTIALIVSDIANPWFGRLVSLVEQNLSRSGYSVMICNSCENAALEQEYLRLLPQKGIDGLIVVPLADSREALLEPLPVGLPVVVLDRPVKGIAASIATDQRQASELLCTELLDIGVKTVALVRGPEHVFTHRMRAQAVRGCFDVVLDFEGPAQHETGRSAWQALAGKEVDAVVCTNNFLGIGAIEAMSGSKRLPPVGCFDEIPLMDLLPMPIACSMQDVPSLANAAVQMMLQLLAGEVSISPLSLPAHILTNKAFDALDK